jgi:hypothetical protein
MVKIVMVQIAAAIMPQVRQPRAAARSEAGFFR